MRAAPKMRAAVTRKAPPARSAKAVATPKTRSPGRRWIRSGGYDGARTDTSELQNYLPRLGSADGDTLGDLPALRARSRDAERNDPIGRGALHTHLDNVVGSGLVPSPKINREYLATAVGLTDDAANAFERNAAFVVRTVLGSTRLDFEGRRSFGQLQRSGQFATLSGGDCFVVRRYQPRPGDVVGVKVQLLEADRIATPPELGESATLRSGIEYDEHGCMVAVHVASHHPVEAFADGEPTTYTRIPVHGPKTGERLVLQLGEMLRPGQSRGVPLLAPVIAHLKQLSRLSAAELEAAVMQAFMTVFLHRGDKTGGDEPSLADLETDETEGLPDRPNSVKMGKGTVVELPEDLKPTLVDPTRPNGKFEPFFLAIVRQIGVAVQIPYELLIKHFQASYSASRAALLEAWRVFELKQDLLIEQFCQVVYDWVLTEVIARGIVEAPGFFDDPFARAAYLGASWTGPTPTQLDPLKEVNAAKARVDAGFSSIERETAELTGQSWERVHAQQVKEKAARQRDGLQSAPAAPAIAEAPADDDTSDLEEADDARVLAYA